MNTKRSKLTVIFAMCTTMWICNACKKCDYDFNAKDYIDTVWVNRDYTDVTPDGDVKIEYILVLGKKTAERYRLDQNHKVEALWETAEYKIKGDEIYFDNVKTKLGRNYIDFFGDVYFRSSRGREYYFRP